MNTELTPLGRLIAAAQKDHQWSNRALERRAEALGLPGFTKTNIGKMKNEPPLHISTATIKNLAVLIQVPERVVVEASIRSTNLEYPEANTAGAAEAIANDLRLSARDKRILLSAISAMTEEAGDGDEEATSLTDAGGTPARTDNRWGERPRVRVFKTNGPDGSDAVAEVQERWTAELRAAASLIGDKKALRAADRERVQSELNKIADETEGLEVQQIADQTPVDEIMQHAAYEPGETLHNPGRPE